MATRAWCAGWLLFGSLALGCSEAEAPAAKPNSSAPAANASREGGTAAPAANASASAPAPASAAELFPPGPGRDLALNNCASCHNLACATIGQRTNARWDSLKESHVEKVSGVSASDLNVVFDYLKANFNDSKPEPKVPPKFLEGGCTPF